MLKKILTAVLAVLLLASVLIATRPAHFRVERSAQIHAPSAAVFPLINDFRNWAKWSPYEKLDPGMKKTYGGAPSGRGAEYAWSGNDKAGVGRMTITDSKPSELVSMKLEFLKPFAATNQATFELTPNAAGTEVKWSMEGENGFVAKAFCLVVDMDSLVGKDFETGLSNLNQLAQAAPPTP
ncbi:MAG: SRPBCC family protein [Polyangiaceae bacterium]